MLNLLVLIYPNPLFNKPDNPKDRFFCRKPRGYQQTVVNISSENAGKNLIYKLIIRFLNNLLLISYFAKIGKVYAEFVYSQ